MRLYLGGELESHVNRTLPVALDGLVISPAQQRLCPWGWAGWQERLTEALGTFPTGAHVSEARLFARSFLKRRGRNLWFPGAVLTCLAWHETPALAVAEMSNWSKQQLWPLQL